MPSTPPDEELKQTDTELIQAQFVDEEDNPIDVSSNNSLTFRLEVPSGEGLAVNTDAEFDNIDGTGDGADGRVKYQLTADDTTRAGMHLGEFVYESSDGSTRKTTPAGDEYIYVLIGRALGTIATGTLSAQALTGDIDANGYDILNVNLFEASTLRDRDTGDTADVGSIIAGGGGDGVAVALDIGNDGTQESSGLSEIATESDANSVATEAEAGQLLFDFARNWPTADTAAGLEAGALDAIGDIDATLRSGSDSTLLTGTAGTAGNLPQFNSDGDLVDSGQAASDVGGGTGGTAEKVWNETASVWGANNGEEQVIDVIPSALISEVNALWSTLFGSDGALAGTNGSFQIRLYDGVANIGSTDSADFVRWNAGESFSASPPYFSPTQGNDVPVAVTNGTSGDLRVSFGFEYE